ncbi:MAG: Mut7-C RNAse domain-containing protein, partial [Armatimonadota bacterium]|nr:Mut7-C RNAse domain-containing protein [Armatimonadota bacterium]
MLGKLAKWLRLIGYDTVYIRDATDDMLVRVAVQEKRILLTNDRSLAGRRLVRDRHYFVEQEDTGAQLRQVIREFDLVVDEARFFTRCPVCNSEIVDAPKPSVKAETP